MAKKKPFGMGMGAGVAPAAGPLKSPPGLKMPTQLRPRHVPSTLGRGPTAPKPMKATKGSFLKQSPMDKSALKPPKMPSVKKPPMPKRPKLPTAY